MNTVKGYLVITMLLFVFITGAHVVRAATGTALTFGGITIEAAVSWPLAVVSAALVAWAIASLRALKRP